MTEAVSASVVYVDANPIAYAFEGPEELAVALKNLFAIFRRKPGLAVTSELTLAEVLPKKKIPDRYFLDLLVWSGMFELRPVTREILIETARYRRFVSSELAGGKLSMPKLPDSIHIVTAIQAGCRMFLSSDGRLKLPQAIKLIPANKTGIESLAREIA